MTSSQGDDFEKDDPVQRDVKRGKKKRKETMSLCV